MNFIIIFPLEGHLQDTCRTPMQMLFLILLVVTAAPSTATRTHSSAIRVHALSLDGVALGGSPVPFIEPQLKAGTAFTWRISCGLDCLGAQQQRYRLSMRRIDEGTDALKLVIAWGFFNTSATRHVLSAQVH